MFKNVATSVAMFAFDTTTGAPKTGDGGNMTPYVSKDYGTVTVLGTTTATEMDATNAKGWYKFTVAQAETNADALLFTAKSTTANVSIVGAMIFTTPNRFSSLVIDAAGLADANAVKLGPSGSGTAQTARDVGASVLLSAGTGAGQLDFTSGVVKANATQWLGGAIPAVNVTGVPLVDLKYTLGTISPAAAGSVRADAVTGAVGSVTGAVGSVTGSVGSVTGAVGSVTARVTANADQLAGQTITAAAGVTFPASVASPTNITAGTITTVTNLTNAPTAGDFTATMKTSITTAATAATPTAAAVTGAVGSVTGNVGGSVASVVADVGITQGGADKVWGTAARTLTSFGTLAASVWDVVLSGHLTPGTTGNALNAAGSAGDPWSTALPGAYGAGTAGKILGTNLDATVSSRLATSGYTAPDNADIATILTRTDVAISTRATPAQILDGAMTEGYAANGAQFTLAQGIYMLWALAAQRAIVTTTLTADKLDGTTPAMTFTLDDATTPTSQTRAT